ncbi:hypothetical protein A2U01_0070371, partial [Trifolium medium]|nr:hypothetical protein [Trifolium medium]
AKGLKGVDSRACAGPLPTNGVNVPVRPQVHISKRLSALGLTHYSFVLCRKDASVV